ncbi:hypothetical protein TRFO_10339 [Tritrichomonas foetus]|uniref:Uncharacterized protein n=1 Tax=Tritrichomonas foetus TaxID=1144522 RepID=A0A1J4JBT0_9EUKA|nr:hypothetical protein TRFO_10339 [Tritrichomonas foetus]|eukprot:OHS95703.1 hypothetical protein TRFO_10339 [Tritrichomonas foetus]
MKKYLIEKKHSLFMKKVIESYNPRLSNHIFPSVEEYDSSDPFGSSNSSISDYKKQYQNERCSRSLNLRQIHRTSLQDFLTQILPPVVPTEHIVLPDINHILDPEKCIQQLISKDENIISNILNQILLASQNANLTLDSLCSSSDFLNTLADCLNHDYSIPLVVQVIQTIITIFPLLESPELMEEFIDDGIVMSLYDLLSSDDLMIIAAGIQLTDKICEISSYGRDAVICLEIHKCLINVAKSENNALVNAACEALRKLFAYSEYIDTIPLLNSIEQLAELLTLNSHSAVEAILICFVEITNIQPSLVFSIYNLNILPYLISLLSDEYLKPVTLRLIGNLCIAQPSQIQMMFDCGLFQILMESIYSTCASDAFWVLSNLVEAVPQMILPLLPQNMFHDAVTLCENASIEIKKEGIFFLATVILFSEKEKMHDFMTTNMIDLLSEMLGSGVPLIVLRCLDVLMLFVHNQICNNSQEIISLLLQSDATDRLEELIEQDQPMITERAKYLLNHVDCSFYQSH